MVDKVEEVEGSDAFIWNGVIDIPNTYSAGAVGSRFLIELRDHMKFMGIRCPHCNRVFVPPRSTCKECFTHLTEWIEVSDKGTLLTYTVDYHSSSVQPGEPPTVYGVIQLDGADTGLMHMLGEVGPEDLHIGMRLGAVFKQEREASILDIKYFRPLR